MTYEETAVGQTIGRLLSEHPAWTRPPTARWTTSTSSICVDAARGLAAAVGDGSVEIWRGALVRNAG